MKQLFNKMKIQLDQQKITDQYLANLAKSFDDNIFYVYHVDEKELKFAIRLWAPQFDDFIHGDRFATVGYGYLRISHKNDAFFIILKSSPHPIVWLIFIVSFFCASTMMVLSNDFSYSLLFLIPWLPFACVWGTLKLLCRNRVKRLWETI